MVVLGMEPDSPACKQACAQPIELSPTQATTFILTLTNLKMDTLCICVYLNIWHKRAEK